MKVVLQIWGAGGDICPWTRRWGKILGPHELYTPLPQPNHDSNCLPSRGNLGFGPSGQNPKCLGTLLGPAAYPLQLGLCPNKIVLYTIILLQLFEGGEGGGGPARPLLGQSLESHRLPCLALPMLTNAYFLQQF